MSNRDLRLSVLDLIPVRSDQTTADALTATQGLARLADDLGFHRYWVAEHHNMPAVASTNPPVLIALLASITSRIRVGSGGVMLPNHAPLVVAEQFGLLEAAFPGRIDLGLGRAPGSDPVTNWALRHGAGGVEADAAQQFPEHVTNVLTMLHPDGAALSLPDRDYPLRATPKATSVPPVWLLGSSGFSSELAANLGLPYVFAHHFAGQGTEQALATYRAQFQPSPYAERPTTFLTVNVAAAETDAEAERLTLPHRLAMLALRTGGTLTPQRLVEEAEDVDLPPAHADLAAAMSRPWVVGSPTTVAKGLRDLAEEFDVDEIMVHPVTGEYRGTAPDASPAREASLRWVAEELLG